MANLTAQDAAALRPPPDPQTRVQAQRYAHATLRLIRLRALHGDTELRCQVPPELVGLVATKLHAARFTTVTLLSAFAVRPNGRLIISWPDAPLRPGSSIPPPGETHTETEDYPEFFYTAHRFLARLGMVKPDAFQIVRLSPAFDRASEAV